MSSTVANIDVTGAIRRLGQVSQCTLYRANYGSTIIDGRYVDAPTTGVQFTATVQSYVDEMQNLPEATRTKRMIKVWSTSQLKPTQRSEGTPGDLIEWNGHRYEVEQFMDRSNDGNYWSAICTAVDQ